MTPKIFAFLLASLFLASCAQTRPPELYLLEARTSAAAKPARANIDRIGLSEVKLPAYARNKKIASQTAGNKIVQDDDNRWAEPPEEAVSRTLSQSLETQLGAAVVVGPFPRGLDPDLRVEVRFNKFLRSETGAAEMGGQYGILSGDGREVLLLQTFSITAPASAQDYGSYLNAVSAGLSQLSQQISRSTRSGKVTRSLRNG